MKAHRAQTESEEERMPHRISRISTDDEGNLTCWDGWGGFESPEEVEAFKEFRRNRGMPDDWVWPPQNEKANEERRAK